MVAVVTAFVIPNWCFLYFFYIFHCIVLGNVHTNPSEYLRIVVRQSTTESWNQVWTGRTFDLLPGMRLKHEVEQELGSWSGWASGFGSRCVFLWAWYRIQGLREHNYPHLLFMVDWWFGPNLHSLGIELDVFTTTMSSPPCPLTCGLLWLMGY